MEVVLPGLLGAVIATLDRLAADLKGLFEVLGYWPALLIVTGMDDERAPKTLTANGIDV
jgi:hypothetical protein